MYTEVLKGQTLTFSSKRGNTFAKLLVLLQRFWELVVYGILLLVFKTVELQLLFTARHIPAKLLNNLLGLLHRLYLALDLLQFFRLPSYKNSSPSRGEDLLLSETVVLLGV